MRLILAGLVFFAGAGVASADPFAMHGTIRSYCCDDWTDKDDPTSPAPNPNALGAFGLIGGALIEQALVTKPIEQTLATPPFAVTLPPGQFETNLFIPGLPGAGDPLSIRLSIGLSLSNLQGTFSANNGPGSFDYCPPAVGPAIGACVAPLSATSGTQGFPWHGHIEVTAGPNQFGGAMGWLGLGQYGTQYKQNATVGATLFSKKNFQGPFDPVGNGTTSAGIVAMNLSSRIDSNFSTSQPWLFTSGTPQQNPAFLSSNVVYGGQTGHAWTTGMVRISHTAQQSPPFQAATLTGSDSRATTGPNKGSGTLTLVSGNFFQDFGIARTFVRGNTLRMNVPEPSAGLAVLAGCGFLIAAGVRRRRS